VKEEEVKTVPVEESEEGQTPPVVNSTGTSVEEERERLAVLLAEEEERKAQVKGNGNGNGNGKGHAEPILPEVLPALPTTRVARARRGEARAFALRVIRDPLYQTNLLQAARNRTLAPAVEVALLHYAWGKPTERVEVGTPGSFDYENLPSATLAERAKLLSRVLSDDPDALQTYEAMQGTDSLTELQRATDDAMRMAEAVTTSRRKKAS
jgi:hypothetical protein